MLITFMAFNESSRIMDLYLNYKSLYSFWEKYRKHVFHKIRNWDKKSFSPAGISYNKILPVALYSLSSRKGRFLKKQYRPLEKGVSRFFFFLRIRRLEKF